jgi:hypothetical protein
MCLAVLEARSEPGRRRGNAEIDRPVRNGLVTVDGDSPLGRRILARLADTVRHYR